MNAIDEHKEGCISIIKYVYEKRKINYFPFDFPLSLLGGRPCGFLLLDLSLEPPLASIGWT